MALMLAGFGVLLAMSGWKAAVVRFYEVEWKSWGPFSGSQSGRHVHEGAAAVRAGAGLVLIGVMLMIWSMAMVWTRGGSSHESALTASGRLATGASLLCLLGGAGCLLPPWHWDDLTFYGMLLLPVVVFLTLEGGERRRWGGRLAVALFLIAVICGPGMLARVAAGMFTPLFAAVHVMMLFPGLMKMEER